MMMNNLHYLHLLKERPKTIQEKVMDSISEEFRALLKEEFRLPTGNPSRQGRASLEAALRYHLNRYNEAGVIERDAEIDFAEDGASATITYSVPVNRVYTEVTLNRS